MIRFAERYEEDMTGTARRHNATGKYPDMSERRMVWFGIDNFSRFSRHVYIGSERIATVTEVSSNGMQEYDNDDLYKAGIRCINKSDYDSLLAVQSSMVAAYSDSLRVPYSGSPEAVRSARSLGITGGLGVGHGNGSGDNADNSSTAANDSVFYYHRDHLGSTMSVTDSVGQVAQTVEYTPWGEVFVEQRNDSICTTPYLFNGKELDEETGLYYYGARYYDPKMNVWYSTDPMQEKYPWVTTYGYCLGNPINAIDSYGSDVVWAIRNGSYSGIIKALNNTKTYNTIFYRFLKNQDNVTISPSSNRTYYGYAPSLKSNNGYNIYIGNCGFVKNGRLTIDATLLAKVIRHEGLHSKYQLINDEGNLSYYPTLNKHMQLQAEQIAKGYSYEGEHETMAEGNIPTFVKGMKEFDANYGTCHSNDWYNAIAWMGSLREASSAWWDLDETTRNKYMLIQRNEQLYMDYLDAKATYYGNKTNKNRAAMNRAKQAVNWNLFNQTRNE